MSSHMQRLTRVATRISDDPSYMAHALLAYGGPGATFQSVASEIGQPLLSVLKLAVCWTRSLESTQTMEDLLALESATSIPASIILEILRRADALTALSSSSPLRKHVLLAARRRRDHRKVKSDT